MADWLPLGDPGRCDVRCEGLPFACARPRGHEGDHEDPAVSVAGGPFTWAADTSVTDRPPGPAPESIGGL